MYMTNEDYYNLLEEILVKHEAGELTEKPNRRNNRFCNHKRMDN